MICSTRIVMQIDAYPHANLQPCVKIKRNKSKESSDDRMLQEIVQWRLTEYELNSYQPKHIATTLRRVDEMIRLTALQISCRREVPPSDPGFAQVLTRNKKGAPINSWEQEEEQSTSSESDDEFVVTDDADVLRAV